LRYAEIRHWCSSALAAAIHGPRIYRDEALPAGPIWPTVERLRATVEGDRPIDIRDRAILLFFVVYGFRAGEVMGRKCFEPSLCIA
jgi:site-specific recombinase XerC